MQTRIPTLIFLFTLSICVSAQTKKKILVLGSTIKQMQGTWVSDQDSLSTIYVLRDTWTFKYNNVAQRDDNYKITTRDTTFGSDKKLSQILRLTNSKDTLDYEVLGINQKTLSLMYLASGRLQLYKRRTK